MCPAQDTFECMNTLHIQYTWECMTAADPQPEPRTAHTSGRSNISTHKQDFQQQPARLAPHGPYCRQVLNLVLAQNTCPGKLPVWHPEVIQGCQTLTMTSEIMDRLLCGLQEERPPEEQILHHPLWPMPGEDSHLSPLHLLLTPALLLCSVIAPAQLFISEATHFGDPESNSQNTWYPHKWPKIELALVLMTLPGAEKESPADVECRESPLQEKKGF